MRCRPIVPWVPTPALCTRCPSVHTGVGALAAASPPLASASGFMWWWWVPTSDSGIGWLDPGDGKLRFLVFDCPPPHRHAEAFLLRRAVL